MSIADFNPNRRHFLAAAAATLALPYGSASAANQKLVAAAFPGLTEDAIRGALAPYLAKRGVDLTVAPALAHNQLGMMLASPRSSPFDALYVSPGQTAELIEKNLIDKIDPSKIPNWGKLAPSFQTEWGPTVNLQINGIIYNPKKLKKPKGYKELFEDDAYLSGMSVLGFDSNASVVTWVEIAKIYGGSVENLEPAFKVLSDYVKRGGLVANNFQHQQTLFQQGDVDVFFGSTSQVANLQSKGIDVDFVIPDTGSTTLPVYIHLAKGSANRDAVYAYIDACCSAEIQELLKQPPLGSFPTNGDVKPPAAFADYISPQQIAVLIYPDWARINPLRAGWTDKFNQLVAK